MNQMDIAVKCLFKLKDLPKIYKFYKARRVSNFPTKTKYIIAFFIIMGICELYVSYISTIKKYLPPFELQYSHWNTFLPESK